MEVDEVDAGPSWMDPITTFLRIGEFLTNKAEVRCIKYKAVKYHLIDGILYRRGYTFLYLWCVHPSQFNNLIYEIHEGTYKSHVGPSSKGTFGRLWPKALGTI